MMKQAENFPVIKALEDQISNSSRLIEAIRGRLLNSDNSLAPLLTQKLIVGEQSGVENQEVHFTSKEQPPQFIGTFSKLSSNSSHAVFGLVFESFRTGFEDSNLPSVTGVSLIGSSHVVEWSSRCFVTGTSVLIFIVAAICRDFSAGNVTVSICEEEIQSRKSMWSTLPVKLPTPKSKKFLTQFKKFNENTGRRRFLNSTPVFSSVSFLSPSTSVLLSSTSSLFESNFSLLNVTSDYYVTTYGHTMSFYVILTAMAIFLMIGLGVLLYFRMFSRLVIEIVDNRHSFSEENVSNFVQNAVLFAYQPILADSTEHNIIPNTPQVESGQGLPQRPKSAPAPGRPFLGILGTHANAFAVKHGVRVIALCRYVWRPPPAGKQQESTYQNPHDDSDPENVGSSPLTGDDYDLTKAALGAFKSGDSRYIVGVVVSEAPNEAQLTYPSPLCEQLQASGFTKFCTLPPLKTALRLRYGAGRGWRKSAVSRMATVMAGLRFYGSSREVIRQYSLKPPRSPLIVEFYDPNSVIFYLPLADELDLVDSRHLTMRLPQELTCPRAPPIPLPETGGLLGSPPLPYKNMNAILTPWDPYANEDAQPEEVQAAPKNKSSIERV